MCDFRPETEGPGTFLLTENACHLLLYSEEDAHKGESFTSDHMLASQGP